MKLESRATWRVDSRRILYTQLTFSRERISHYAQGNSKISSIHVREIHRSPLHPKGVRGRHQKFICDKEKNPYMIKGNGNNAIHRRPLDLRSGHE